MFPIDRFLKLERDSNLLEYVTVGQTQYIFTEPDCGDNAETHTVREWLGKFGILLEDEFFLQWHKTIIKLSGIFHKEEKKASEHVMELAWTAAFFRSIVYYRNFTGSFPVPLDVTFIKGLIGIKNGF